MSYRINEKGKEFDKNIITHEEISVREFMVNGKKIGVYKNVKVENGNLVISFYEENYDIQNVELHYKSSVEILEGDPVVRGFFDDMCILKFENENNILHYKIINKGLSENAIMRIIEKDIGPPTIKFKKQVDCINDKSESFISEKQISLQDIKSRDEINFLKDLMFAVLLCVAITFGISILVLGTFSKIQFFTEFLSYFDDSDSPDTVRASFHIAIFVGILVALLSNIGAKSKSETIKRIFGSDMSDKVYIGVGVMMVATIYWPIFMFVIIGTCLIITCLFMVNLYNRYLRK